METTSTEIPDANTSLAHWATIRPAAVRVFLRHGLDFCCGGKAPLADACRAAGIDVERILAEIETESGRGSGDDERWDLRPVDALVDHIVTRYHETLRADLPALVEAARKVERVHGDKASCPKGLADLLEAFRDETFAHLAKEEQVLFPALRQGLRGPRLGMPITVMRHEHDEHGRRLHELREKTGGYEPPPEACATWRALYEGLARLDAELMEHIHLENNVLFPRVLGGEGR
ncbi:MAG: iron-sulfur cluster repair di-iron protein [Deltaproteobacteria bacterium]|nr:MAG: iron-sulfur cluster repair di-iron protein [Deltaproteobacteria bacterium]